MSHRPPYPLPWLALLAFAVAVYTLGLDGQYIPSNGDELVYTHIARLTAASGQWLPLVSELEHMRNTKPPLLFWQALVAGDWGLRWSLAALRAPSLIYTLLLAGAIAWSVQRITRHRPSAWLAACVYLAFFCTFRFGRTFLTSAPETFWLNVPMFWLLWHRLRQPAPAQADHPGWLAHGGFGLALGIGLAYKSFALIAPAAATLWCAQLVSSSSPSWREALQTSLKVGLSAALAISIFSLWFVFDPDPSAVWQEFVIGENAGKLSNSQGYWHVALFGGGVSMAAQLLAYVQNAGPLALVVLGLAWTGLSNRWRSGRGPDLQPVPRAQLAILLTWLAVWLVVFTLPSQRSARYVIPAMPALAMLIALYWQRIGRGWFWLTLPLCALAIVGLGRIAWAAHGIGIGTGMELGAALAAAALGLALVLGGLLRPAWTRGCTVAACLAVYACFGLTSAPLNATAGQYSAQTVAQLQRARVAVPNGFNGQFERFQFLLPGNQFIPYDSEQRASARTLPAAEELRRLLASHDAVIWLQADLAEHAPPCLPDCTVLGTRWEVKGRHQSGEINWDTLWYPQGWLFRREWLVAATRPVPGDAVR